MPPEWTWKLDWELEIWFDKVKAERDKKYGTSSKDTSDSGSNNGDSLFDDNVYFERLKRGEPIVE